MPGGNNGALRPYGRRAMPVIHAFFLNGLEITSVKNVQIEYPAFGFFTDGKSKLKGYGFTYSLLMSDDDEEEQ